MVIVDNGNNDILYWHQVPQKFRYPRVSGEVRARAAGENPPQPAPLRAPDAPPRPQQPKQQWGEELFIMKMKNVCLI